jgi:hypothetical protein
MGDLNNFFLPVIRGLGQAGLWCDFQTSTLKFLEKKKKKVRFFLPLPSSPP